MKKFDFEEAIKQGQSPKKIAWIKENCRKAISEEFYVAEMIRLKLSHRKNPSYLKSAYRNLKDTFGFWN